MEKQLATIFATDAKEQIAQAAKEWNFKNQLTFKLQPFLEIHLSCLLYTSDAADERSSVDLGGRRIIKKKNKTNIRWRDYINIKITEKQ